MFSKLDFGFQGVILGMEGYHPIPQLALASGGPLVRRQRPWPAAMELYWRNGLEELDMPGSDAPRFGKESLHLMSWWVSWLMSGRVDVCIFFLLVVCKNPNFYWVRPNKTICLIARFKIRRDYTIRIHAWRENSFLHQVIGSTTLGRGLILYVYIYICIYT